MSEMQWEQTRHSKKLLQQRNRISNFPHRGTWQSLLNCLLIKLALSSWALLSQELQQVRGNFKDRRLCLKPGRFTSLILLFSWTDLNAQIPSQCTEFVVFIENRNIFTDLSQTSANGIWWELESQSLIDWLLATVTMVAGIPHFLKSLKKLKKGKVKKAQDVRFLKSKENMVVRILVLFPWKNCGF